ncbi:DUF2066 domain-containing protein [Psychromonas ossibalaenae]|uniref:DUF2066 domain-containing protein n=1 Tax=Psychromonas ossibalaenae TaxID=444922 RepID=UPI00037B15F2|nr:DUF2066 domain-containing protein [Psychromonas ossibalaenae]
MKFIFLTRSLFILLIAFTSPLSAGQFDNPYQGNIVVGKQSEDLLKQQALKQVLVKVSGNTEVVKLAESKLLLKNVQSLLSQFGYRLFKDKRYFFAVFDQRKITQALKDMQQPVWGDTRPTTLVWLIKDDKGTRKLLSDYMINNSSESKFSSVLQSQQHDRGITLQFPLMDLDDNLALSVSDVAGRFYTPIAAASARYAMNHFVAANLKQVSEDNWYLDWVLVQSDTLTKQNKMLLSDKFYGEKSQLLAKMTNAIADYYAGQYAVLENEDEKFKQTIYINGITSLAQLTKLNDLLSGLLAIASFEVVSVQDQQVTINVKVNGGLHSFANALSVQTALQEDLSNDEKFHFYWR